MQGAALQELWEDGGISTPHGVSLELQDGEGLRASQ